MSREIRFRAWDKAHRRMIHDAMPLLGGGVSWPGGGSDTDGANYLLMQSTGMQDSEGREMFEADVVEVERHGDDKTWFEEVVIEDLRCMPHETLDPTIRKVVIGNIHENPEIFARESDI